MKKRILAMLSMVILFGLFTTSGQDACEGADSSCNVLWYCNLCGPNGESIVQVIQFDGFKPTPGIPL